MRVIAEVGSVHDGSFGNAKKLIDLATALGANAVKFQTHLPEFETVRHAPNPAYFSGENRYEYFERTGFERTQWSELVEYSEKVGIDFISSPFSVEAAILLKDIGCRHVKIASGEVSNLLLLEAVNELKFDTVYLSSGMSDYAEIDVAVSKLRGSPRLCLMQCTSEYPCQLDKVGLNVISKFKRKYDLEVGFSDHTCGVASAYAAFCLGASVLEKHLTFSRHMYGSDAPFATEPEQFRQMIDVIRELEVVLNSDVDKNDMSQFHEMRRVFTKSLYYKNRIDSGRRVRSNDFIALKNGGIGIAASEVDRLVGSRMRQSVEAFQMVEEDDFA